MVNESKAGRVEFRVDKTANLHVPIGKVSFEQKKLYENMAALMEAIKKATPAAAKGTYIKRVTVTSTMGPGIKVDPAQAQSMEVQRVIRSNPQIWRANRHMLRQRQQAPHP